MNNMSNSLNDKRKEINKVNKYYIIILLLAFIILLVGFTMAYFSVVASQKENGTKLYTGTLEIDFEDGVEIKNPLLIPRSNPSSLNDTDYAYTNKFNVISLGTLDQTIDVFINVSTNEFKEGILKYKVFNVDSKQMKEGIVSKSGETKILENVYLASKEKATFTLVMWLEETGVGQNEEQDKSFVGTMKVKAIQIQK